MPNSLAVSNKLPKPISPTECYRPLLRGTTVTTAAEILLLTCETWSRINLTPLVASVWVFARRP